MGTLSKPLAGLKIGKWQVMHRYLSLKGVKYNCLCDCGNVGIIDGSLLRSGKTMSCGKCSRLDDSIIGTKIFNLTILSQEIRVIKGRNRTYLNCICFCGNTVSVIKNGNTQSCGCIKRKFKDQFKSKKMRSSWAAMKARCYEPKADSYPNYGAKGITVCGRWLESFRNFYDDMKDTWAEGLTLDRFPNKVSNYEPSNCRWATDDQQAQNKTTNKLTEQIVISIRGSNKSNKELGVLYGVNQNTIGKIKNRKQWKNI